VNAAVGAAVLIVKMRPLIRGLNSCFVLKLTYICIFAQNYRYFMNIMSMEREQQASSANNNGTYGEQNSKFIFNFDDQKTKHCTTINVTTGAHTGRRTCRRQVDWNFATVNSLS